jgi:hypothetical protein
LPPLDADIAAPPLLSRDADDAAKERHAPKPTRHARPTPRRPFAPLRADIVDAERHAIDISLMLFQILFTSVITDIDAAAFSA